MNDEILLREVNELIAMSKVACGRSKLTHLMLTEQDAVEDMDLITLDPTTMKKVEDSGDLGKAVAKGAARGAKNAVIQGGSALAVKGLMTKLGKIPALAKYIPAIGDAIAWGSLIIGITSLAKTTKAFTDYLLEVTGEELTGVRSLLGEYSIFEANADDLNRIADTLETINLSEEQWEYLKDLWLGILEMLKTVLIDFLLANKTFMAAAAGAITAWAAGAGGVAVAGIIYAAAAALQILPVERLAKEGLFKVATAITEAKEKAPELMQNFFDIMITLKGGFIPIIGFISDTNRMAAFARIDDQILKLRDAKGMVLDAIEGGASGAAYQKAAHKARAKTIEKAVERSMTAAPAAGMRTVGSLPPGSRTLPPPTSTPSLPGPTPSTIPFRHPVPPGGPTIYERKMYTKRMQLLAGIK